MIRDRGLRRIVARLSLVLLLFGSAQGVLHPTTAHAAVRFVDTFVMNGGGAAQHDHRNTICHSCPGHICLEQHAQLDQAPLPLAILTSDTVIVEPWPAATGWAYPPTAPPPARPVDRSAQPRAPPPAA